MIQTNDMPATNVLENQNYAGFWIRLGASLVDTILQIAITLPLLWFWYDGEYFSSGGLTQGPFDIFVSWILPIILVLGFWAKWQATPGKMAIRSVIVDAKTGEKPTTFQFVIRYVGYIVSTLPLFLGFLWVAWDKKKQGFHDKLSGTAVVYRK